MKIITTKNITCSILEVGNLVKGYGKLSSPKCYIFSEDKINLLTQIEIAKSLNGGFFNIENLTFKRYISLRRGENVLSNEASTMAIRRIIQENKSSLKCFKSSNTLSNLAKTLFELISQLKSASVSADSINTLLQNEQNTLSVNLYNKLSDVNLIYSKYQQYLTDNNLFDSYEYLSIMPDLIKNDDDLKNATVIVVGYTAITKQRELIFKALNDVAKNFIAVVIGNEKGAFYTNELLNRLKTKDCEICESQFNSTITKDALVLHDYLYNKAIYKDTYKKQKPFSISISAFKTPYEEIENIAIDIIKNVKDGKARYKDVAVTIGNLNEYSTIVKRVFSKYKIPYYIDETKVLSDHPLVYFIVDVLELVRKNLAPTDVKNFARNSIFITDKMLSDGFCNYIDKYAISRKSIKEPFKYEDENLSIYENIRLQILEFYQILSNAKTVNDYVNALKNILESINVDEKLLSINEKLQNANQQSKVEFNEKVLEKLNKVFNELIFVIKDSNIDINDFKNVLLSGTDACKISGIPLYMDAVFVSNLIDVKLKSPVFLYAVGICGDIPASKSDIALLTDKDIDKLCSQRYEKYQVSIEPKIQLVNKREVQNVCTTLISFKNQLKVSFPILSNSGQINLKSDIIKNLLSIFDIEIINTYGEKVTKYTNEFHNNLISSFVSPEIAIRRVIEFLNDNRFNSDLKSQLLSTLYASLKRMNLNEYITILDNLTKNDKNKFAVSSENALLCIKNKEISATTLENYYSCPFYNFANGSLKLKEKEIGEAKSTSKGTILHDLLENFVKRINEVYDKQSCDKLTDEIYESIISKQEYQILTTKPNYVYSFGRLKEEARKIAYNIYLSSKKSLFKPILFEQAFGKSKKVDGIPLYTNDGVYNVKGKVDRVDAYNDRIRIIDYKSGEINSTPTQFYIGKKLQLYLYMNAFLSGDYKPAGAYYSPINIQFSTSKDSDYELQGKTLDNSEIIHATDIAASETKHSEIANLYTKKGQLNKSGALLSEEEFNGYLSYSKLISANAINEISSGFIEPTPYDSSCTYCKFNGMCDFCVNENGKIRKIDAVKKEVIIQAVNNSTDDKNKKEIK